jgi:peroxiredoxin
MQKRHFAAAALSVFALAAPVLRAANLPRKAPDFAIHLGNGKQVTLSQSKGKVVALLFILTTCPHCQNAIRCLSQEQKEFGPRGFQTLASAIEDMAQINVPDFVRRFDPPFPVGFNNNREALDFMQHPPMVQALMPLIAFIDREGFVRAQYEGYEPFFEEDKMAANIHAKIKELMGPAAPAKRGIRKKAKSGK